MRNLQRLISKYFIQKRWDIWVKPSEGFTQIEVTDPLFLWVNINDLLTEVIVRVFHNCSYLSVSQFVDRAQWDIGMQDEFLRIISKNFSLPIVLTRSFESNEEKVQANDSTFTIHVIGSPEKKWLASVLRFGMTSNPNIIYGLQLRPEKWPLDVIEWNTSFRKWFELEADDSQLKRISEQVDLLAWTEDGHLNIGLEGERGCNELLETITKLAEERSLTPIIKLKKR